jgi:hypothetical protein
MSPENENHPGRHPASWMILYPKSLLIASIIVLRCSSLSIWNLSFQGCYAMFDAGNSVVQFNNVKINDETFNKIINPDPESL